jgi:hypothetical protein
MTLSKFRLVVSALTHMEKGNYCSYTFEVYAELDKLLFFQWTNANQRAANWSAGLIHVVARQSHKMV